MPLFLSIEPFQLAAENLPDIVYWQEISIPVYSHNSFDQVHHLFSIYCSLKYHKLFASFTPYFLQFHRWFMPFLFHMQCFKTKLNHFIADYEELCLSTFWLQCEGWGSIYDRDMGIKQCQVVILISLCWCMSEITLIMYRYHLYWNHATTRLLPTLSGIVCK